MGRSTVAYLKEGEEPVMDYTVLDASGLVINNKALANAALPGSQPYVTIEISTSGADTLRIRNSFGDDNNPDGHWYGSITTNYLCDNRTGEFPVFQECTYSRNTSSWPVVLGISCSAESFDLKNTIRFKLTLRVKSSTAGASDDYYRANVSYDVDGQLKYKKTITTVVNKEKPIDF